MRKVIDIRTARPVKPAPAESGGPDQPDPQLERAGRENNGEGRLLGFLPEMLLGECLGILPLSGRGATLP
jgi:hypothetical protein